MSWGRAVGGVSWTNCGTGRGGGRVRKPGGAVEGQCAAANEIMWSWLGSPGLRGKDGEGGEVVGVMGSEGRGAQGERGDTEDRG